MYAKRGSSVASSLLVSLRAKVIKLYDIAQPKLKCFPKQPLMQGLQPRGSLEGKLWAERTRSDRRA